MLYVFARNYISARQFQGGRLLDPLFLARSVFNMASEIDPILVRGLHLLHSKHPKALEQLCALRDEVLGKKPEFIPEVGSLGESKSSIYL